VADYDRSAASGVLGVLDVACGVLSDLNVDVVLERVLEAARQLTGAKYAALGVLDRSRRELERFKTAGLDDSTRQQIGALPRGRGVLGEVIADPRPLRLADVGAHPRSYGFPSGHPPMKTFLGVPLIVAGEPYGNLYLTDKRCGEEFTVEDEQAVMRLAELAGVAIDHARRYSSVEDQRSHLKRTVEALDATMQISHAIGDETDLEKILELVAKRGRALISARALVIEHERNGEIVVVAGAGDVAPGLLGRTVDARDSLASAALRTSSTLRLEDGPNRARFERHGLGRLGFYANAGLVVPLIFRGKSHGVLIAVDRLKDGPTFTADDQRLLEAFAVSAATAIATARSVELERVSQRIAAAENERARWARELHDETLQNLGALRIGLAAHLRKGDPDTLKEVVQHAVAALESEIANLRSLITDLRPPTLDDLGVQAAIEVLADRARQDGIEGELRIDLRSREREGHPSELETALYRITQEALTNARKHGGARRVEIEIRTYDGWIHLAVCDDGSGFDPGRKTTGFGLHGMRERAELLGGILTINSAPGEGTEITANLPTGQARSQRAS
jgi:two-component system, NarL family, sensor histidine kinase DevS